MKTPHKQINESWVDHDIVSDICDIFDVYLINEEHGTEYLLAESDIFHRQIAQLFEEEDKI